MPVVYHVTHHENIDPILEEGLFPGWGDDGLGVYLFSSISSAREYAARGGWLEVDPGDMRILEIDVEDEDVLSVTPHPEWKNPEFYASVLIHPMEDEDESWKPVMRVLTDDLSPSP